MFVDDLSHSPMIEKAIVDYPPHATSTDVPMFEPLPSCGRAQMQVRASGSHSVPEKWIGSVA